MLYPEIHPAARGLIFDLDGTLANSIPIHNYCWDETCKTFNYTFDADFFEKMTGMPTRAFAEYIKKDSGCNLSVDELIRSKQQLFYNLAHRITPYEKMTAFVIANYGKIPMSIGTGGGRRSASLILKTIGLEKYFPVVVSADDVENHKPHPDTFLKCAEMMGVPPSQCQVFEDGEMGMLAAVKAGMMVTDVRVFY